MIDLNAQMRTQAGLFSWRGLKNELCEPQTYIALSITDILENISSVTPTSATKFCNPYFHGSAMIVLSDCRIEIPTAPYERQQIEKCLQEMYQMQAFALRHKKEPEIYAIIEKSAAEFTQKKKNEIHNAFLDDGVQQLPLYSGHHPEVCSKSRLYWPCVKYNVKSGIFLLMTYQLHGNIMPPETTSFSGILEGMLHPEPIASI